MHKPHDYTMFSDFIAKYKSQGFVNINPQAPGLLELEQKLQHNKQFFYVANLVTLQILFVSNGCERMLGVAPEEFTLSTIMTSVHPSDFSRNSLARSMLIKAGFELMMKRKGIAIHSINSRLKVTGGGFSNHLFQGYAFFTDKPAPNVYLLLVLTDLSGFKLPPHGSHYYAGDNMAMFRYPDAALLQEGHVFTDREFQLIHLIAEGLNSEQIADTLSLTINTVNTHRRNILKKTRNSTTQELVIELKKKGIL